MSDLRRPVPPPPAPADLRVVVVTYSPGDSLRTCLDSLRAAVSVPYEVVLADNGSVDGAPEAAVAAAGGQVRLVRSPGNVGYGAAANLGARGAPGWVLVCNPDVEFAPGSVDALLAAGDRWPRAGSLGPAILTPAGEVYPSARSVPDPAAGIAHAALGWWWPTNPWTVAYRREEARLDEHPCGWLSGSCLLLRAEAWASVGGFDPGFFMYLEDLDLGERLWRAGWLNVFVPSARVVHTGGHATSRDGARMTRAHHESAYRYVERRWARPGQFPLRLAARAGLAARLRLMRALDILGSGTVSTRSGSDLDVETS